MTSRLLVLLAGSLVISAGCATKRDIRDLRGEMQTDRAAQEALLQELRQEIRRQHTLILDSMTVQDVRLRGDLRNRIVQIERQLIQIQELTGQGQQRLAELRQEMRAQEEALRAAASSGSSGGSPPGGAAGSTEAGDPLEMFASAEGALQRGSFSTARAGFEEFLRAFPQHQRAPAAQLHIGDAHDRAKEPAAALQAYQRVLELHPNSPQAATALYRAAMVELSRNNRDRARTMFNQLGTAYPRSPEATLAKEQVRKMR